MTGECVVPNQGQKIPGQARDDTYLGTKETTNRRPGKCEAFIRDLGNIQRWLFLDHGLFE